jgi:hypothetical protein
VSGNPNEFLRMIGEPPMDDKEMMSPTASGQQAAQSKVAGRR